MRTLMVVTAVLAAFAQVPTTAYGDAPPRPRSSEVIHSEPPLVPERRPPPPYPDQTGLCRRAPALPQLGQEPPVPTQERPSRWSPRRNGKVPPAIPVPMPSAPPALPPPPRVSGEAASAGDVAASRAAPAARKVAPPTTASDYVASPTPILPERERRGPRVQSGLLTAGEHDDLLNPALYARYVDQFLATETVRGIPRVDTRKVLSIIVQDNQGAPVPFATVTLQCRDGNTLSLTTMADGRAVFFPDLDRLGESVTMTARSGQVGVSQARNINIADVRGAQEVRTRLSAQAPRVTQFDLAVVIDATGSMGDEIAFLKAELADIIAALNRRHRNLDVRVAMVVYRDQGDDFVTRTFEFTSDMNAVQRNLSNQQAGGGGDTPEAMEVAMTRAVGLNWRNNAVKSMLLVADAPPHAEDVPLTWTATEAARAKRIQIVPVAASGVDDGAQYIMRAMAAATQSRYAFLTDDSGIGNPHAEPSVDCYHVTKLDNLVRRILDAQISGRRIEPEQNEIIRTVGDYDNGKCRGV
jgi:Mg-chelatase subunit ChlD